MNNCLITWVSGNDEYLSNPSFDVFFNSLNNTGFSGDKFILTNNLGKKFSKKATKSGFEIINVVLPSYEQFNDHTSLLRDRWFAYFDFLKTHVYNNVIITDCRDVYFQRNLDEYISKTFFSDVILCSEGIRHSDSKWNFNEQTALQSILNKKIEFNNWQVINGGFQLGSHSIMKNFCLLMWTACFFAFDQRRLTDQCVMNLLSQGLISDKIPIRLSNPTTDNLCVVGKTLKENVANFCEFKNDKIYCKNLDEPYYVFHQWDRTIYSDLIADQYCRKVI